LTRIFRCTGYKDGRYGIKTNDELNDLIRNNVCVISGSLSPRNGASSGCGWRNGLQYGG
jgi:hypothetical protein